MCKFVLKKNGKLYYGAKKRGNSEKLYVKKRWGKVQKELEEWISSVWEERREKGERIEKKNNKASINGEII